ncbi:MAG: S-methyl-5'-thioinosine phosphorylase [Pseudomonadales bacterium]|nr:S-methyl-5'-thioinosine phosphorylase [Pseudomonadales bacterium]
MSIAIIGGTGLDQLDGLQISEKIFVDTPYGDPSAPVQQGTYHGKSVFFLARHGEQHQWPPHRVNYRANMFALKKLGVEQVIAVNAVGGIHHDMGPAVISVPDQIIDYTWGRIHTYSDDELSELQHIDFTFPYAERTRELLLRAADAAGVIALARGVYGCTQGPRLETAAEIRRMQRDGCDLVGMTAMPEAPLAREIGLDYASLCVVANWAAGCTDELITMEAIDATLKVGMDNIRKILQQVLILA